MDQQQFFQQIRENFGGSGDAISSGWLVMFVGVILFLVGGLSLWHWWRTRGQRPAPLLAFLTLAGRLGLNPAEQWLLIRIARRLKLPTPITLLVSPRTLRHHARDCAAQLSRRRSAKLMRRVDAIADKLFGAQGATA